MPEHVRLNRNRREFIRDSFAGFGSLAMTHMAYTRGLERGAERR